MIDQVGAAGRRAAEVGTVGEAGEADSGCAVCGSVVCESVVCACGTALKRDSSQMLNWYHLVARECARRVKCMGNEDGCGEQ